MRDRGAEGLETRRYQYRTAGCIVRAVIVIRINWRVVEVFRIAASQPIQKHSLGSKYNYALFRSVVCIIDSTYRILRSCILARSLIHIVGRDRNVLRVMNLISLV